MRTWMAIATACMLAAPPAGAEIISLESVDGRASWMTDRLEGTLGLPSRELRSPFLASALTLTLPLGLWSVGWGITGQNQGAVKIAGGVLAGVAPLFLTAGHVYAGDPVRGGQVLLLGPVALAASAGVGYILALSSTYPLLGAMAGAMVGYVGYNLWAAMDAWQAAARFNEAQEAQPSRSE